MFPIKMTGAEWKKFGDDPQVWTDGSYVEGLAINVNGVPGGTHTKRHEIPDDAEVLVITGTFYDNDIVPYGYYILDLIVRWREKND